MQGLGRCLGVTWHDLIDAQGEEKKTTKEIFFYYFLLKVAYTTPTGSLENNDERDAANPSSPEDPFW